MEVLECGTEDFFSKTFNASMLMCSFDEEGTRAEEPYTINTSDNLNVAAISISSEENVKLLPSRLGLTFPKLTNFQAWDCSIATIDSEAFRNLPNLVELSLSGNLIETVPENAFDDLDNLERLILRINKIKHLGSGTFNSLKNLKELQLHRNLLESLGDGLFDPLTKLETLEMSLKKFMNEIN